MRPFTHVQTQRYLDALFVGESPSGTSPARTHLESCASCRAHFDRLAAADRALAGEEDGPGPFERTFTRRCVESALETATTRVPALYRAAAWLAAALVVVGAGTLLWRTADERGETRQTPEWKARGGGFEGHALELLCGDVVRRSLAGGDTPARQVHCPLAGDLKIAAMNISRDVTLPYLTLVSVSADGVANRLLPEKPEAGTISMRVGELARMVGLGEGIRLAVNHTPGKWRVVGLFTAQPLRAEELQTRLAADDGPRAGPGEQRVEWTLFVEP